MVQIAGWSSKPKKSRAHRKRFFIRNIGHLGWRNWWMELFSFWVLLKSDPALLVEQSPLVSPRSSAENAIKKVPIWAEKIILPAFSTNSSALFTLGGVFAVDSTASSKDIPELKNLIHYQGEISLKPSWTFPGIREQRRSCEVLRHCNKHRAPTPHGAMTGNCQWLTNHFDICSCNLFQKSVNIRGNINV